MAMKPGLRKFVLTSHVAASVGWLGAVAASLALGIGAVSTEDAESVRAIYLTLELVAWSTLVPLSLASLVTGVVQSLGTVWGLFRHYWVLAKLVINLFASLVLLMYTQTLGQFAELARPASGLDLLRSPSVAIHSAGALALLLAATVLSVYKPRGMTRYGQRKQREATRPRGPQPATTPVPARRHGEQSG